MTKRRLLLLILLFTGGPCTTKVDAGESDLDRLRDAVSRGQVMPLSTLQDSVRRAFPGDIIGLKLDEDDGRFVYEFKILQTSGRLLEIEVDARDGKVLDIDNDD